MSKKKFRVFAAALAAILLISACKDGSSETPVETQQPQQNNQATATAAPAVPDNSGANDADEMYAFTYYFNDDWHDIHPWGADELSKKWKEEFNIQIDFSKADADPEAKLNIMIASNDLPDVIMMNRGPANIKMAELGMLVDLAPLQANNPTYDEHVMQQSQEILKIDGKLYALPCWPRKAASGGNQCWLYNQRIYEACGSPPMKTLEDLYEYAVLARELGVTEEGLPIIPFIANAPYPDAEIMKGFYRSYGGFNGETYGRVGSDYQLVFRDPKYRAAILEANRWYREGLILNTSFTDSRDQILEKLVAGRVALMYYPMDSDDYNHFRQLLVDTYPGDDYVVLSDPVYPPAGGLDPGKIYADAQQTVGSTVVCITSAAEKPQRIFDFLSYLYTKEASNQIVFGPPGFLWDTVDANNNPVLKDDYSDHSAEYVDSLGIWFWCIPAHADNVDMTDFGVNATLPKEKQNWVAYIGANIITPVMFCTDEYNGMDEIIDPQSEEGVNKILCEDQIGRARPLIIMADSAAEAEKRIDDLIEFCDKNGLPEIESILNEKYHANVAMQGYTSYTR